MREIRSFDNYDTLVVKTVLKIESRIGSFKFIIWLSLFALMMFSAMIFPKDSAQKAFQRTLSLAPLLLLPLTMVFFKSICLLLDLRIKKKVVMSSSEYELYNQEKSQYLILKDQNNFKLKVSEEIFEGIEMDKPILIEFSKISSVLLNIVNA